MKYLFVIAAFAFSGVASAQTDDVYYFKKRLDKQKEEKGVPQFQSPVLLPNQNNIPVFPEKQNYTLANGNKVRILLQDNMPCIKPDMSQFNMPNAGTPDMLKKNIAAIPNPSQHVRVFKSFPSEETKQHH